MRILISTTLAVLAMTATPVFAKHFDGNPPGQAAKDGADVNEDGRTNGRDYAPGQVAKDDAAPDKNNDGHTNGQDFAPGQNK